MGPKNWLKYKIYVWYMAAMCQFSNDITVFLFNKGMLSCQSLQYFSKNVHTGLKFQVFSNSWLEMGLPGMLAANRCLTQAAKHRTRKSRRGGWQRCRSFI